MAKQTHRARHIVTRSAAVLAGIMAIAATALAGYTARTWNRAWNIPLPDIHASRDVEVIRQGEYLVYGPAHCADCHAASSRAAQEAAEGGGRAPLVGGLPFPAPGLGVVYAKNLTPDPDTGIGRYSDGQLARMLRYAVRPDGRASVRLLMPYDGMSDADLRAIISFLRSQTPIRHAVPDNEFTLLGKIVKSVSPVFKPRTDVRPALTAPTAQPTRERGEYLARAVGNCSGCHTKRNPLTFATAGPEFAGGEELKSNDRPGADPALWFRTPNLTPMPGSALNKFPDRETFVARFQRGGRHYAGSPMPWEMFSHMSGADLGALYEYFHSLQPQPGPSGEPTFAKSPRPSAVDRSASR